MNTEPLKVGDDVFYCFNGDCYPDGKVARFTPNGKYLYTTTGKKYVETFNGYFSQYRSIGGTWALVKGVYDERNPSF